MRFWLCGAAAMFPAMALAQSDMAAVDYDCADNRALSVAYINAGEESFAVVQEAGHMVPMKIAMSGSGARYLSADDRLELWTKGPEAMLTLKGDADIPLYRDCVEAAQTR